MSLHPPRPLVSIIIPVLNEEASLESLLPFFDKFGSEVEVIVVDGGSSDRSCDLAQAREGIILLESSAGRATQLNRGAETAKGSILWFLHADSVVSDEAVSYLIERSKNGKEIAGAFRFSLDAPGLSFRIIEFGVWLRCALFKLPYGDQGIFVSKSLFEALNGFPEYPILEDVYFVRELKKCLTLDLPSIVLGTSARKWRTQGIVRVTLTHLRIILLDLLGVSPFSQVGEKKVATGKMG